MNFRFAGLKLLPPAFVAVAMVLSAGAQQAAQPIVFSSAQSGDNTPSAPSLAPQAAEQPDFADKFQTPSSGVDFNSPSDSQPLPPMPANPSVGNRRLQKNLDERDNWALMTPAEIFGVTTPEKIMGITERDAAGREIKLTQPERWLARQNQPQTATNGLQGGGTAESLGFSGDQFNPDGTSRENPRQFFDSFLKPAPDNNGNTPYGQNEATDWPRPFGAATATKIDPEQQAAMERFRQMLEPSPFATTVTPQPDLNGKFSPAPTATLNSILDQPALNPIGASFTPLSSGIVKPQGLSPLPGVSDQNNLQPAAVPSWMPQPAPWLSQGPQPFGMPQRKF
jgi:hypothetical protein